MFAGEGGTMNEEEQLEQLEQGQQTQEEPQEPQQQPQEAQEPQKQEEPQEPQNQQEQQEQQTGSTGKMDTVLKDAYQKRIVEIRNAWRYKKDATTLPLWAQVEDKSRPHRDAIEITKIALPDVDEETKNMIVRELLLTLRCNSCERARSDSCHFSVCIRGLLSGRDIGGL